MTASKRQCPGDNPGFIYLLKRGPYYKIGQTYDLEKRLKVADGMTTPFKARQFPIELVWSIQCTDKITAERSLHQHYQQYHCGVGEWFLLPDEVVALICSQSEAEICATYDHASYRRPMF